MTDKPEKEVCDGCGCEIDPLVCWCGDLLHDHRDHAPIPMGCTCNESKDDD